jgi:hypothetical protein
MDVDAAGRDASQAGAAIGRPLGAFLGSIHDIPMAAFDASAVIRESLDPHEGELVVDRCRGPALRTVADADKPAVGPCVCR